ncbi:hypothetical protein Aperf_G00000043604 [Anoplocephala perfoliata]
MNEGISPPGNSIFDGKDLNSITFNPCEPNVYQQYVYGNTSIMVPQFHPRDDVFKYRVPNSPDERLLILCPNNGNINLIGLPERASDSGTQTVRCQADNENTDLDSNKSEESRGDYDCKEKTAFQHPGFILLSVKHEKIREMPPLIRGVNGNFKGTAGLPVRKISRKRLRKTNSINSGALLVDGVEFLSAEDASKLTSNMTVHSPTLSRFRVTRIADVSSWWIPNNASMNICIHDLKTSSLPASVARQHQKIQSSVSYCTSYPTDWEQDFWKYLEPDYKCKTTEDTPL